MSDGGISSAAALLLPGLQAAATILILEHQKDQYDDIADQRIALIDDAVATFIASIDAQIASGSFRPAYGSVPEAILYEPIDAEDSGISAIEDSLAAVPAAKRYLEAANRIMEQDSIVRLMALDGRYVCSADIVSCTINELLKGMLPVDSVVELMKDGAELAAMNGRIGNTHDMTMRDLGIARLKAQAAGRAEHRQHLQSLNRDVSPIADRVSIRDFTQTPAQRISLALTEAQLIQASLQNQANAAAAGDPTKYAELQTQLQSYVMTLGQEGQRGNLVNQFVPNYAAMLAPAIDSISQALIGSGGDPSVSYAGYDVSRASRAVVVDEGGKN